MPHLDNWCVPGTTTVLVCCWDTPKYEVLHHNPVYTGDILKCPSDTSEYEVFYHDTRVQTPDTNYLPIKHKCVTGTHLHTKCVTITHQFL